MENLWAVSMGRQFLCMASVGPPNKYPCMSTSKNTDINNKSKQNYPNYQMQIMLLKPVLCLYKQEEVVESQQIQPNVEQLSIVIGDECVGQAWWNYVCQYSAVTGVYIYNVHTCKLFLL